jgi:hypothetical protein
MPFDAVHASSVTVDDRTADRNCSERTVAPAAHRTVCPSIGYCRKRMSSSGLFGMTIVVPVAALE